MNIDAHGTHEGNGAYVPSASALRARRYRARKRDANEVTDVTTVTPSVTTVTGRRARRDVIVGVTLIIAAALLAVVGMSATVDYSMRTAAGADRVLLAALAVAADLLTLMLPAATAAVWRGERRVLAVAAAVLWLASAGVTASNLAGFVGVNGDGFVAGRQTSSIERSLILERAGRLRAERASITETRPVGAIVVAIRNATKGAIDGERTALAIGRRRDQLDAELAAIEPTIAALPAVYTADPSASTISNALRLITGSRVVIADETLARMRVILLLALPLLGGLVLAVGAALLAESP